MVSSESADVVSCSSMTLSLTAAMSQRRIFPSRNARTAISFAAFITAGIVPHWGPTERQEAADLYVILAGLGGEELVGKSPSLVDGTFWSGVSY